MRGRQEHGRSDEAAAAEGVVSRNDAVPIKVEEQSADVGEAVLARGLAVDDEGRPGERGGRRRGVTACRRPDDENERSEEHTSELQSPCNLVCRLLLEKKKKKT